jgi:hypothetical protein
MQNLYKLAKPLKLTSHKSVFLHKIKNNVVVDGKENKITFLEDSLVLKKAKALMEGSSYIFSGIYV